MLIKQSISWPLRQIKTMIEKGNISFDVYFQRNDVWNINQRSKLIQTILEGYPIPPVYSNKDTARKVYELMDGRQRTTTITMFLNNEFALKNVSFYEDGVFYDLNGYKYEDLSEEFQNRIRDYSLTVYYYDDLTEEEELEMFDRLNSGTVLTSYQKARATCPALKDITALAKHDIFQNSFSSSAINSMKNEHMVTKIYIMLNEGKPCLDRRYVDKCMATLVLETEDKTMITSVLDRMYEAYQIIKNDNRDQVLNRKICKRMTSIINMATIVPLTYQTINEDIPVEEYAEFLQTFFSNPGKGTSISEVYNQNCLSGAGHEAAIKIRLEEIKKEWELFNAKYEN